MEHSSVPRCREFFQRFIAAKSYEHRVLILSQATLLDVTAILEVVENFDKLYIRSGRRSCERAVKTLSVQKCSDLELTKKFLSLQIPALRILISAALTYLTEFEINTILAHSAVGLRTRHMEIKRC